MPFDENLIQYASTDLQRERLEKWLELGSQKEAAKALGCSDKRFRDALYAAQKNAARDGYAPGHWDSGVAAGYKMGKVTVQRGPGGVVERVWERQSPELERGLERLKEAIAGIVDEADGLSPVAPLTSLTDRDLLTVYPMGDPHCGLLAWGKEAGENFDLVEFERRTKGAIDRLVDAAPPSDEALFINLGDFFHADDSSNRTPRGNNSLDVDGRHTKIAVIAFRCMVYAINKLTQKHARVTVWNKPGNHDPHAWLLLSMSLNAYYSNDERVNVPVDPCMFSYMRFGKVLIGSTHGHGPKINDLPMIMAADRKEDWGVTDYRVWFIGHFHHRQVIKDLTGCTVEIARTLAGSDAWHHGEGYRSYKDMQAVVFHKDFGEIERHTCSLAMIQ